MIVALTALWCDHKHGDGRIACFATYPTVDPRLAPVPRAEQLQFAIEDGWYITPFQQFCPAHNQAKSKVDTLDKCSACGRDHGAPHTADRPIALEQDLEDGHL